MTLRNTGSRWASLDGWRLKDRTGHSLALSGRIDPGADREILLERGQLPLNNTGDDVFLLGTDSRVTDQVAYSSADVVCGERIWFV